MTSVRIRPYQPSDEPALLELERSSPQGRGMVLGMHRTVFARRAQTFEHHHIYVAERDSTIVGVGAVAKVPIIVGGRQYLANFFFDFRVHPKHRREGIGSSLYMALCETAWSEHATQIDIATMKSNNVMTRIGLLRGGEVAWWRAFRYLSLPTASWSDLNETYPVGEPRITTALLSESPLNSLLVTDENEGFSVWRTDQVYDVYIERISAWYKPLIMLSKIVGRYRDLDLREGASMKFAVLCTDPRSSKTPSLGAAARYLHENNIDSIVVIKDQRDAVGTVPYIVTSNTDLGDGNVVLDVRCL